MKIKFKGFIHIATAKTGQKIVLNGKTLYGKWMFAEYDTNEQWTESQYNDFIAFWKFVLPETVSQFIGIYDDNNQEIYQNDVIITQPYTDRPYSKRKKEKSFFALVEQQIGKHRSEKPNKEFDYHSVSWGIKLFNRDFKYGCSDWGDFWICRVVGNAFDGVNYNNMSVKEFEEKNNGNN